MNFADILASKLAAPIAIAVAILSLLGNAALGFLHWSDGRTIATLTASNTKLAGDLRTSQGNQRTLEDALKASNASVGDVQTAAQLAAANAKVGQLQHENAALKHDAAAAELNKLPALPEAADHCAAASKLIHDTLAGEHVQ